VDWIFTSILLGSGLIALSILTSAAAFRFGAPLLLVFLCIGLIAGEDGLGLEFNDAEMAYLVGSLALAVILFDSGFGTRVQTLQRAAVPAFVLATVGVLLTTLFVGVAAYFIFDLPWLYALLMGAVISSTDAAAVFFLLRAGGVKIYKRVRSLLEVESGSNDPMAIFLTVMLIELILADRSTGVLGAFVQGFGLQMGLGLLGGFVGGYLIVEVVNRVKLEEALYPILVMALALCVFAIVAYFGGSGFLAIYLAGIVAGNRPMTSASVLRRYQQGMTWLAQIVMFLVLGLFITPSDLGQVLLPALLLGVFLIVLGRPLAVLLCLLPFGFDRATMTFSAWVGLRGAVSILLGILPMVMGLEGADIFLNVAFIMVVTSLLIQGWSIKPAARWLKLIIPSRTGPMERIELELPGKPMHELVVYHVLPNSPLLAGVAKLPDDVMASMILRKGQTLNGQLGWPPQVDDYVYLFSPPQLVPQLDRLFSQIKSHIVENEEEGVEFEIEPNSLMQDLVALYALPELQPQEQALTVAAFLSARLKHKPVAGDQVTLGPLNLVIRHVHHGELITAVVIKLSGKT
jgi:cell volume regulation protein A